MENAPTAAAEAPKAPETEATPTTNPEPAKAPETPAPDMHGFTSEQLADMKKFFEANGGFDKVKSKISNPEKPAESVTETAPAPEQSKAPEQPAYKAPEGSITAQEFLAQQYFQNLSKDPKYAAISDGISKGEYLKEMSAFGINALNPDGSINDQKVRMYLDLKAQTVPTQPTGTEPGMSNAPTVEYYQISGDKVSNMEDAYKVLEQDMRLKAMGQAGHPKIKEAEEFIKTGGKPAENK